MNQGFFVSKNYWFFLHICIPDISWIYRPVILVPLSRLQQDNQNSYVSPIYRLYFTTTPLSTTNLLIWCLSVIWWIYLRSIILENIPFFNQKILRDSELTTRLVPYLFFHIYMKSENMLRTTSSTFRLING